MTNAQYFTLRRLHSLLGVFPLGVFLFNHLLTNSTGILGAKFFEEKVALIHLLGPALPIVEALFIFIPLSLHIALGVYIATQARHETRGAMAKYGRNWAYTAQRWTGWLALAFILYHVIHLRFIHLPIWDKPFSVTLGEMFYELPFAPFFVLFYLLGGLAVIFHFANGLCTFCMSWGITVGPKSQQAVTYAAGGIGAVLVAMLVTSIFSFWREGAIMNDLAHNNPDGFRAYVLELQQVHKFDPETMETPEWIEDKLSEIHGTTAAAVAN